ncbi:MAG: Rrf2 family transcriptional regulator [Pseudomonadota bacterium]
MHLTTHTDYALRVLLYTATANEPVTINKVSDAFGISKEHLRKVVHSLSLLGYLATTQGRNGGIRLSLDPSAINIRDVVMQFESSKIVECFDAQTNTCPIDGACGLKLILAKAHKSFMDTLGQYHLSDLIKNPRLISFSRG